MFRAFIKFPGFKYYSNEQEKMGKNNDVLNGLREEIREMNKVREIMTHDVETCSLLDNVYEVAVKMKELNVGAIPVVDSGVLKGIITDRDLVVRGIAEKRPGSSKVDAVMTENLVTIHPDDPVSKAVYLMREHQIRRLPVVEEGKLVGIVALGDIATNDKTDYQAKKALSEISEPEQASDFFN